MTALDSKNIMNNSLNSVQNKPQLPANVTKGRSRTVIEYNNSYSNTAIFVPKVAYFSLKKI